MINKIACLFFVALMMSCNTQHSTSIPTSALNPCEQIKYHLIWNMDLNNPQWKMEYLDYVSYCMEDSATAIQLAKLEGESGNYHFIVYGLMTSDGMEHFENIYKTYPIGFHCPGCDANKYGEIYNRELKKYLKANEGLDFDSIVKGEFEE
jgi:hypothetical protein